MYFASWNGLMDIYEQEEQVVNRRIESQKSKQARA
jgi:hypothetical protein